MSFLFLTVAAFGMTLAAPLLAAPVTAQPASVQMSSDQLLAFADAKRDAGDLETAQRAYRALTADPNGEVRREAQFRLALLLADRLHRYREAALLLRRILDEKPAAARVRIELARIDVKLGRIEAADRELRAARTTSLPADVERIIRFYQGALSQRRRFGVSLEAALAPDSNVNRATGADTITTVLGGFALTPDARARPGTGLLIRGQTYSRTPLSPSTNLLARLSVGSAFYRENEFDDLSALAEAGLELHRGSERATILGGVGRRSFGRHPYSATTQISADWLHALDARTQLRTSVTAARIANRRNAQEDATDLNLRAGIDHAFSARAGGGVEVAGSRELARDPGYSLSGGQIQGYVFHEYGALTATASMSYGHLVADARFALLPARRRDDRVSADVAVVLRRFHLGSLAPLVRVGYERNRSSIELYGYRRLHGEIGLSAAF